MPKEALSSSTQKNATPARTTAGLAVRLWRDYLSKYWVRYLCALIAMFFYSISFSAIPVGVEWINSAFSDGENRFSASPRDILTWGPVLILVVGISNALAQYLQTRLSSGAALSGLRDIQSDMFRNLMRLDFAQGRSEASGQMISRFTNDPTVLRETLMRVVQACRDLITLIGLCAVMIYYDWLLFLVVLLVYGLIGWPIVGIGRYLRKKSAETQHQAGEVASLVKETMAGTRIVKSFQLEDYETARGLSSFERRLGLLKNLAYMRALNEPLVFVIGAAAIAGVVATGAWRVSTDALAGPQFVAFMVTLIMLSQPARGLSTLNAVMQEGFGAFERMLSVIDMRPMIKDRENASSLLVTGGAINFTDVGFSYDGKTDVLKRLSLKVPSGGTVAIVGPSGSGKSTLFSLLLRLYDPESGHIRIDDQDVSDVTLASLRSSIALVNQDAFLFDDTILENIRLGNSDASIEDIYDAAKAADAHDFTMAMPAGYQTTVGEGGEALSGGQRQRIAIARAFLKDAPVLLLDEATSALDSNAETNVQRALDQLTKGRSTMVIAHRLSTVRNADLIAVMENGTVIDTGTHETLIETSPVYARLVELQFTSNV